MLMCLVLQVLSVRPVCGPGGLHGCPRSVPQKWVWGGAGPPLEQVRPQPKADFDTSSVHTRLSALMGKYVKTLMFHRERWSFSEIYVLRWKATLWTAGSAYVDDLKTNLSRQGRFCDFYWTCPLLLRLLVLLSEWITNLLYWYVSNTCSLPGSCTSSGFYWKWQLCLVGFLKVLLWTQLLVYIKINILAAVFMLMKFTCTILMGPESFGLSDFLTEITQWLNDMTGFLYQNYISVWWLPIRIRYFWQLIVTWASFWKADGYMNV